MAATRKRQPTHEEGEQIGHIDAATLIPTRILQAIRDGHWHVVRTWVDYTESTQCQTDFISRANALCDLPRAWTADEQSRVARCIQTIMSVKEEEEEEEDSRDKNANWWPPLQPLGITTTTTITRESKHKLEAMLVQEMNDHINPLRLTTAQVTSMTKQQLIHHLCLVRYACALLPLIPGSSPLAAPAIEWADAPTIVAVDRIVYTPTTLARQFQTPAEYQRARRSTKDRDSPSNDTVLSPRSRSAVVHIWETTYCGSGSSRKTVE
jgi:hypothetical protein